MEIGQEYVSIGRKADLFGVLCSKQFDGRSVAPQKQRQLASRQDMDLQTSLTSRQGQSFLLGRRPTATATSSAELVIILAKDRRCRVAQSAFDATTKLRHVRDSFYLSLLFHHLLYQNGEIEQGGVRATSSSPTATAKEEWRSLLLLFCFGRPYYFDYIETFIWAFAALSGRKRL